VALVVETGEGLDTAESYVSVADATTYVTSFYLAGDPLLTKWTAAAAGAGTQAEIALRRATRDIDLLYGASFVSDRLVLDQALEFPRVEVDGIPTALEQATVEQALVLLNGYDALGPDDRTGGIESQKKKLGDLETEVKYFYAADIQSAKTRKVDSLIAPLLDSSAATSDISVALVRG
jgi:hypothetical protein